MKRLICFILLIGITPAFGLLSPDLEKVISKARSTDLIPVDIVFKEQANAREIELQVKGLPRPERRVKVAKILKEFSRSRQKELLAFLREAEKQNKVKKIKPFWIINAIYCEATPEIINKIEKREDIFYVDYDLKPIKLEKPRMTKAPPDKTREIAWGVSKINADQVWPLGYTGQGVVVGHIDTGCNYNHVDLADHMWTDPNYPNHGWNFELDNNDPMDVQGHGTHTAGSVASDGTAGSQCGVAPDAQIMALRVRTQADTTAENQVWDAMQFVVSPPLSPSNGGDIITMSLGWVYAWSPRRSTWRTNCDNVGAAGVLMIVAAGNEDNNSGPPNNLRCPGDVPPPWQNPENGATGALSNVVTVGATDINDAIASFSSRGPVTWDTVTNFNDYPYPPGLTAPDVSAPGVNIKSCAYNNNTGYLDGWNGTSMATPHTAGTVALMLQKNPTLTRAEIDSILEVTAVDLGSTGKDNDFGAGRIDALAAINATPEPGAPSKPTIISPFDFAELPTLTPTLKFTTTDPQGDDVIYKVYWDTDTAFSSPESSITSPYASGAIVQFTFPTPLTNGMTYWWKVRATDTTNSGYWSGTTNPSSFTINTSLPPNTCAWFQTTGAQFFADTFNMTQIQGDSIILQSSGFIEDTLLSEDFESGIPAGWTVIDGNGDGEQWQAGTTNDIGTYPPPNYGTSYAFYSDDDAGNGVVNNNEELISPAIYIPASAANLQLQYGYGFRVYQVGEVFDVKVRFFSGGSWTGWTTVATYTTSNSGTETIDLTSYLPADSVQVEWMYHDESSSSHWGYATACDNVLLSYSYTYQNNTGDVVSSPVVFNDLSATYPRNYWGDVVWHKASAGDSIGIQVEYFNGATWQLIPDALIPNNSVGNFTNLAVDTVSLANVTDTVTYNTLRLRALLYRITKSPGEPALLDWEVGNLTNYIGIAEQRIGDSDKILYININPTICSRALTITYSIGSNNLDEVELRVYDATGRLVKKFDRLSAKPFSKITWDGRDNAGRLISSGVYFVQIYTKDQQQVKKAILLR